MEKWRYSSTILYIGNRWRYVVSFMLKPLYFRGSAPSICWIGDSIDAVE
jgi:hypothetical protein